MTRGEQRRGGKVDDSKDGTDKPNYQRFLHIWYLVQFYAENCLQSVVCSFQLLVHGHKIEERSSVNKHGRSRAIQRRKGGVQNMWEMILVAGDA